MDRRDLDREELRGVLIDGMTSPAAVEVDPEYFDSLRQLIATGG